MNSVPEEYAMEAGTSVLLDSCQEESILMETVKSIVNANGQNEEEAEDVEEEEEQEDEEEEEEDEYFAVEEISNEQGRQMDVSTGDALDAANQAEQRTWLERCRVCTNSNEHLIPIFEGEGLEHDLCSKIHKYLPIQVSERDSLPLQLCYHCAATLLAWHELAEGCLDAERRLLQMQCEFQQKQQFFQSSALNSPLDGLSEAVAEEVIDRREPLPQQSQQFETKGENNEESTTYDSERSSRLQTPFKVFLDQSIFWRPNKKPNQTSDRQNLAGANTDSVWIAVVDSTLNQSSMMSDPLVHNDSIAKQDCRDTLRQEIVKEYNKLHIQKSTPNTNENSKQDDIILKCEVCQREFFNAEEVDGHIKMHNLLPNVQESYQCVECGKNFKLKDSYLRHMRIHTDERPFTCHVCGKQFRDSGGLSRHLKDVHAKLKNFSCDICGNSFASKATRDDHRRTHTGERPYVCDSCGKTFKSKASLYIHSKLHTDEFPHPCSYCHKKFRRRQEMLAHITTHTGEKNYGCDVCAKRFRVKSELVRHKLVHSEDKPFVCTRCGLAFRQKRYLNNHIKSRHIDSLRNC